MTTRETVNKVNQTIEKFFELFPKDSNWQPIDLSTLIRT